MDSVIVVAPNWLGDAVMALPAIADVRRSFARARLVVAARRAVAAMFTLVPSIDEVITLEWNGKPLRRRALQADLDRLHQATADVAILLPNSFSTAWMLRSAGVAERWGYATDLRRPLLTRRVRRPRGSMHQGAYYQRLMRELGIDSGPLEPSIVVSQPLLDEARALLAAEGWDGRRPLIAVAPGAAYGTAKRWLPRYYAQAIEQIISARDAFCVLVGSGADAETIDDVRTAMSASTRTSAIDWCGRTSLTLLAAVLRSSAACLCNDSGAMHLAAAVGTPVVAIFGPTREYETAPLAHHGVPADVLISPVWCRPCMLRECPIDHRCMRGIEPSRVTDAVGRIVDLPSVTIPRIPNPEPRIP